MSTEFVEPAAVPTPENRIPLSMRDTEVHPTTLDVGLLVLRIGTCVLFLHGPGPRQSRGLML